jgi:DNA polymerase-3 subunit gamma/tau
LVNESSAPGEPPPLDEPPTIDYEYLDSVLSDGGLVVASAEGQSTSSPAGNDLEAVRLKWSGLLDWLRRRSSYIATYLEPAELEALEGDWLQLRFSFKLHHDRVADPRNTTVIEQGLQAVMGRSFKVRCQYVPPATSAANEPIDLSDPVLRFALDKFGGRAEWVDR